MSLLVLTVIANAIVFGLLFVIWRKEDYLNLFLKILFLTLTIMNGFVALHLHGWVIRA